MTDLKLYEISAEIADIINADEFDEQRMDELAEAFETKAAAIVHSITNMKGFVEMCKAEEKRIAERRKAVENRIESIKSYLHTNMEANDFTELKIGTQSVRVQNSTPSLVIENEEEVPEEYKTVTTTYSIDKKAILRDISAGQKVKGCRKEQGTHLRIR